MGQFSWPAAVIGLYIALSGVYAYLGMWRYAIFRAGIDDLIFTQVVNGAFSGFSSTVEGSVNHFLVHFSPVLFFAFPFVKALDGPRGLILLQCLLAAATIFPLWGLASARFPKWLAFATTLVAATYPVLSAEAVGDFHELAFAPPLAATLVWAIDRKRRGMAIAAAALLATVKEDQFVSLAFIGIVVALMERKDRRMRTCGVWIATIGVAAAVLYFAIVRPLIDVHFQYFSLHYYEWWRFPATPAGFADALSPIRPQYLFAILLPLAFLPLASRYAIFALPGLAEVLLSHEAITMVLGAHYTATWSPYLLCAFVDGASVLYRRSKVFAQSALIVALLASIWTSRYYSPIAPGFALYRRPGPEDRLRDRVLSSLPRTAVVGSGAWVLPHLAMNPNATVAMENLQTYLVFDAFTDPAEWNAHDAAKVAGLVRSGTYRSIYAGAGIVVLKRP